MANQEPVFAPGSVQIVADYYAFPLSCSDATTAGMLGDCPSPKLKEDLAAWGQEYTENRLQKDWPGHADWVVRGRGLAVAVRREIRSPEIRVFYLEESEGDDTDDIWIEVSP